MDDKDLNDNETQQAAVQALTNEGLNDVKTSHERKTLKRGGAKKQRTKRAIENVKQTISEKQVSGSKIKDTEEDVEQLDEKTKNNLHRIAKELLSTEESYVDTLYLLDQIFHKLLRQVSMQKDDLPESVVTTIFSHLSSIYNFHSQFLLPQLRERVANWDSSPRIGDIMKQAGPYLKMYSFYVENLNTSRSLINEWMGKSTSFSEMINNIQKLPDCKSIPLQEHMLAPVQRTPRYQLLLENFLKKLPVTSPYKKEVESALELVVVAANHSNNHIKNSEGFQKLMEIYNKLSSIDFDTEDFSRKLVKEGNISKIDESNGRKVDRYLYLFNDMLLYCKESKVFSKLQGKKYQVVKHIDLDGMTTSLIDNENNPFVFCVKGIQNSIEFACETQEEMEQWISLLDRTIQERKEKQNSYKKKHDGSQEEIIGDYNPTQISTNNSEADFESNIIEDFKDFIVTDEELGTRAPCWIKEYDVTMCMMCGEDFNFLRRRNHCKACGWVICSNCSKQKSVLPYDGTGSLLKVCGRCFIVLSMKKQGVATILEKSATKKIVRNFFAPDLFASTLHLYENTSWSRVWCVVSSNLPTTLCCYKARWDVKPYRVINLEENQATKQTEGLYKYIIEFKKADEENLILGTSEGDKISKIEELLAKNISQE